VNLYGKLWTPICGDFINIPAFKKHRVDWTTPDEETVWLGVRYGEAH
jgi:hypothetical protein